MKEELKQKLLSMRDVFASKAAFFNRHCLHLKTWAHKDKFPEKNYYQELLAHTPPQLRDDTALTSNYCRTVWMTAEQSSRFLVCFNASLLYQDGKPINCENYIFVLTPEKQMYIAKKGEGIQHSSFNRGGYLVCAGYISVKDGQVTKILTESGHYEPTVKNLSAFIIFLKQKHCDLGGTQISHSLREFDEVEGKLKTQTLSFR